MSNLPWIDIAESYIGLEEVDGGASNPEILKWAKELDQKYYTTDSIPWCSLFTSYCLYKAGVDVKKELPNPLWARDNLKLGVETEPCFGAVMVFGRDGGGHVAFAISQDDNYYHVLGGNQGDKVSVIRHAKSGLLGARWPREFLHLKTDELVYNRNFQPG